MLYTFTARITQTPEGGRDTYVIQIDGRHDATHHSTERNVVLVFNQPVTYVKSNARTYGGDGTSTLTLTYTDGVNGAYHNNERDNIGLGQMEVKSNPGLAILNAYSNYCNEECIQHDRH